MNVTKKNKQRNKIGEGKNPKKRGDGGCERKRWMRGREQRGEEGVAEKN